MKQIRSKKTAPVHPGPSFLRAEVLAVLDEDTVMVRPRKAPTEEVRRAEIAAIGYVPAVGDRVLLGQEEGAWVVTGAFGAARRRDAYAGLVSVSGDDLTLSAPGRIVLRAPEIVTQAGRLEVDVERLVEHAGDTYRHVEGLAELQAGRARTLVAGAHQLVAGKTSILSDEDTVIDGRRVLLG